MAQDRKVFVGGVPQDLKQEDLYTIFDEFSSVKKAWLQKCRTNDEGGVSAPQQNHRGFGFVIFHEASAIEELLGSSPSRFVVLRNGAKLEVKRALSSNKMNQVQSLQESIPNAGTGLQEASVPLTRPSTKGARPPGRVPPQRSSETDGGHPTGAAAPQRPKPLPIGTGATGATWSGATLDGGLSNQLQGSLPPATALYAAATMGIPSPLGGPRTDPVTEVPGASGGPGAAAHDSTSVRKALREAIVRFYHEHRPEKLAERDFLDFICSIYEGREAELDEALRQKYGEGLRLLPQTQSLTPPRILGSQSRAQLPGTSPAHGAAISAPPSSTEPMYAWPAQAGLPYPCRFSAPITEQLLSKPPCGSTIESLLRGLPPPAPPTATLAPIIEAVQRDSLKADPGSGTLREDLGRGGEQADVGPAFIPVAATAGLAGHPGTFLDEATRAINSRVAMPQHKDWLQHAVW